MGVVSGVVVVLGAMTNPDLFWMLLLLAVLAVTIPIFGYLYAARLWGMLDE